MELKPYTVHLTLFESMVVEVMAESIEDAWNKAEDEDNWETEELEDSSVQVHDVTNFIDGTVDQPAATEKEEEKEEEQRWIKTEEDKEIGRVIEIPRLGGGYGVVRAEQ